MKYGVHVLLHGLAFGLVGGVVALALGIGAWGVLQYIHIIIGG